MRLEPRKVCHYHLIAEHIKWGQYKTVPMILQSIVDCKKILALDHISRHDLIRTRWNTIESTVQNHRFSFENHGLCIDCDCDAILCQLVHIDGEKPRVSFSRDRLAKTANQIDWLNLTDNLVPVVVQDVTNGEVLMLAYMNRESLEETWRTKQMVYFSRSRQELWRKGESSGHIQELSKMYVSSKGNGLVAKVYQAYGACHLGYRSCFFRQATDDYENDGIQIIEERVFDPSEVYGS